MDWTRDELILAFNLYCKIPFGRISNRTPEVIQLADLLGRTPSAVSWKLANFARFDESLQQRNIRGARHGSKADEEIWREFSQNWDGLAYESEKLLAEKSGLGLSTQSGIDETELPREGKSREAFVKVRVNQSFFRAAVLAAYEFRCCITGLAMREMLNASHIVPWSVDVVNRVNPSNGLCLNALHDRAFDRGYLTITPAYEVRVSQELEHFDRASTEYELLTRYHGAQISLPSRFLPNPDFLMYHNDAIFRG